MVLDFIVSNWAFLTFILLLSLFLAYKKKNLEIQGKFPIMYMLLYKTKLGLDKMKRWSAKYPRSYLALAWLAFSVGVLGLVLSLVYVIYGLFLILDKGLETGGGLVLPIQTESGTLGGIPVFAPPFFEWLIALIVLVVVHEFAHGVIAQRFNIKVKSSGFAFGGSLYLIMFFILISVFSGGISAALSWESLLVVLAGLIFGSLPILPAAFVEPDPKQLEKAKWWEQIAVFGAGSTSNFIFGAIFVLLLFGVGSAIDNTMEISSVDFYAVSNQSSLAEYGIVSGSITHVDGVPVSDIDLVDVTSADGMGINRFLSSFVNLSANESLSLTIDNGTVVGVYDIVTYQRPDVDEDSGMIGIVGLENQLSPKDEFAYLGGSLLFIQTLFWWIALLNIGIGIMNLLPLWITDGGQITRTLFLKWFKKKETAYSWYNFISWISLILLIFTIFPSILRKIIALFMGS